MKFEKKLNIILIAFMVFIFPFTYHIHYHILYLLEKHKVENIEKEHVVVFYDDFDTEHGNIIIQAFSNELNSTLDKYEIIKFNQKDVRVEVLEPLVLDLLNDGKQVYFNSSVIPPTGDSSFVWNSTYKHFLKYENMTLTQSVGNNLDTAEYLKTFTDQNQDMDNEIYTLLNDRAEEIKAIALSEDIDNLLKEYNYLGLRLAAIKSKIGFDRNDEMRALISKTISPIIVKYQLEKEQNKIIDMYSSIINSFSFAILITNTNKNVIQVGASVQADIDRGNTSFIDFRIKNLVNIDVRENPIIYIDGEKQMGTSISSPVALANIMNQSNTINQ